MDSEEDKFFPFQGRAYALKIYSFQNQAIAPVAAASYG
jgi:hypothetical protein